MKWTFLLTELRCNAASQTLPRPDSTQHSKVRPCDKPICYHTCTWPAPLRADRNCIVIPKTHGCTRNPIFFQASSGSGCGIVRSAFAEQQRWGPGIVPASPPSRLETRCGGTAGWYRRRTGLRPPPTQGEHQIRSVKTVKCGCFFQFHWTKNATKHRTWQKNKIMSI